MKKSILCFLFCFSVWSLQAGEEDFQGNFPTEKETLDILNKNFIAKTNQYNTTKAFKIISLLGVTGAGVGATTVITMNKLNLLEQEDYQKYAMITSSVLAGSLIIAIITTFLEKEKFQQMLDAQETMQEYAEDSDYLIGEVN